MRAGFRHPAGVVVGVFVIAAVVGVATAWAGASKSSVEVAGGAFASTSTECPRGTALVSQGFGTKEFAVDGSSSVVVRIDSHRSGTGLESRAVNFSELAGNFDAYAYCSKLGKSIRVVRDRTSVPLRELATAKARCPRGSAPIAGGFGAPGFSLAGPQPIALTSRRQGRAWLVEAVSSNDTMSGQAPGKIVAYAYCLRDAPKISVRSRTRSVGRGDPKTITANCPKGRRAISGGFDGNIAISAQAQAGGAVVSRRAQRGGGWKIRAVSVGESAATATVFAYCAKR